MIMLCSGRDANAEAAADFDERLAADDKHPV
jgi:hypothetical protein